MPNQNIFPPDFIQRIKAQFPNESQNLLNSLSNQESVVSVRTHPQKISVPLKLERVPWSTFGYYLPTRPIFSFDPLWHCGAYYVQEASSMLMEYVFNQIKSKFIAPLKALDFCAAPGGKSWALLSVLEKNDLLVANEINTSRNKVLQENLMKCGCCNTVISQNQASDFQHLIQFFDVVVVDAPCSGEGMFRKDIRAVNEWSTNKSIGCAKRQKVLLDKLLPTLKTNGYLIYSTCTFNPEENELQIQSLIRNGDFERITFDFPAHWQITDTLNGGYYCYPHKVNGEGFFIAVLKKVKSKLQPPQSFKNLKQDIRFLPVPKNVEPPLIAKENYVWLQHHQQWIFLPEAQKYAIYELQQKLRIHSFGSIAYEIKHQQIIPTHALALSAAIDSSVFSILELTGDEAIMFFQKSIFRTAIQQGIYLCRYYKIPLGFLKVNANHSNFLFSTELRLRKNPELNTWSLAHHF